MRGPLALLTAIVAAAVAGCRHVADESAEMTVVGPLAEAAQRTRDAGTARLRVEVTLTSEGVASAAAGEGEVDYEERRGRVLLSLGAEIGDGEPGPDGGGVEAVTDGATVYARSALLDQFFLEEGRGGQTGSWVRWELGPEARKRGIDLGALLYWGAGGPHPAATIDYLLATGAGVQELGVENVRGAPATHYRTTVDLRGVADDVPSEDRDAVRRSIAALVDPAQAGKVPVDAWVDDEGLVRRLRVAYGSVRGTGGEASLEHTLELFDFGAELDIEPPASDDVIELEELTRRAEQS